MPSVEEIANAMYKLVADAQGQKKLKPMDLTKAMVEAYGVDKQICKSAIRELVDNGRLVYSYFGGSFLEIPKAEG
jgi:predicted secreted protein